MTSADTPAKRGPLYWFPALDQGRPDARAPISTVLSLIVSAAHGPQALAQDGPPFRNETSVRLVIASNESLLELAGMTEGSWMDVRCRPFTIELSDGLPTYSWLHPQPTPGMEVRDIEQVKDFLEALLSVAGRRP